RDAIDLRAGDDGADFAALDLHIENGAVANIGAAARQTILEVAVAFEIVAPGLAPHGTGDGAALHLDGRQCPLLFFGKLGSEPRRVGAALGDRNIGTKAVITP